MAQDKTYETLTVLAAGVTKTYPLTDAVQIYDIKASGGVVVLTGNVSIAGSGTPSIGSTYTFLIGGGFTLGGFTFTIFGTALTVSQCLYKQKVFCYYNGTTWDVYIDSDDSDNTDDLNGGDLIDGTVTNAKLAGSIAITKLVPLAARGYITRGGSNGVFEGFQAKTSGQVLIGDGTDIVSLAISGDATLASTGALTLAANAVTTTKINDANVTLSKLESKLLTDTIIIPASFEAGEVGAIKIKMNYAGTIGDIYAIATKAIANTDVGTIVLKQNSGTTMTVTTPISFAASDTYGTAYTSAVTANNTFVVGDILTILTAKTTAGGKVLISLKSTRT